MSGARESISPAELEAVAARYDLGALRTAREFRRGSRQSPKVVLATDRGEFLLKRRAPGRDDPALVAFTHAIQNHLAQRKFPIARLIGTRGDNSSMVELEGRVYELFEFAAGEPFDGSPAASLDAGRVLAFFHRLLGAFQSPWEPARGSYHSVPIDEAFDRAAAHAPAAERLRDRFAEAGAATGGVASWPEQIIHADWHPGNMVFREGRVAAVLDFDSARLGPRAIDLANALLQFAMAGAGEWPPRLDEPRLLAVARGYEGVPGCAISTAELGAIPWLMIQALIAEAVLPIARTGHFGGREPGPILEGVDRAAEGIRASGDRLRDSLASCSPAP